VRSEYKERISTEHSFDGPVQTIREEGSATCGGTRAELAESCMSSLPITCLPEHQLGAHTVLCMTSGKASGPVYIADVTMAEHGAL